MSYILNKTDGTILTEILDGEIDQDTTNLTLIGRTYKGFGEYINENYIKLLENFSNTAPPSSPIRGQLWFDTSVNIIKVYDGFQFKPIGSPFVDNQRPDLNQGDFWFNSSENKLYFYDGFELTLVGPTYTLRQGKTGFEALSILDEGENSRVVIGLYISNQLIAVVSNIEFTPRSEEIITGLVTTTNPTGKIFVGFNFINENRFINISDPIETKDAANKNYVDMRTFSTVLDVTGMSENDILQTLNFLSPSDTNLNGKLARIHQINRSNGNTQRENKEYEIINGTWVSRV